MAENTIETPEVTETETVATTEAAAPTQAAAPSEAPAETPAPAERPERSERYDRNEDRYSQSRSNSSSQRNVSDLLPELQSSSEDAERTEVENGRAYEITYIVVNNNPEAVESTQKRVRELVEGVGGAIDNVRVSETRRLAYPINKRAEGIYIVVNARFEKSVIEELERYFKIEETVLRHVVLREN